MLPSHVFLLIMFVGDVHGHGKVLDPPGRNAVMNPGTRPTGVKWTSCPNRGNINYSDKGMFCGGLQTQANNGGKCSACGDNYAYKPGETVRPHDYGGKFATDITAVRAYKQGQIITVKVLLSAAHKGSFQFRICNMKQKKYDQYELADCFLSQKGPLFHLLKLTDGSTNYTKDTDKSRTFTIEVKLPDDLTCPMGCTFQWWYRAGNNPPSKPQEHFVNCADILIMNCQDYKSGNHAPVCALGETDELLSCNDEDVPVVDNSNNNNNNAPTDDDCNDEENGSETWNSPSGSNEWNSPSGSNEWNAPSGSNDWNSPSAGTNGWDSPSETGSNEWNSPSGTNDWNSPSNPGGSSDGTQSPMYGGDVSCALCVGEFGEEACSYCCKQVNTVYNTESSFINTCCKVMCPALCPATYCSPTPVYYRQPNCYLPSEYGRRTLDQNCEDCKRDNLEHCTDKCCEKKVTFPLVSDNPGKEALCRKFCDKFGKKCPEKCGHPDVSWVNTCKPEGADDDGLLKKFENMLRSMHKKDDE